MVTESDSMFGTIPRAHWSLGGVVGKPKKQIRLICKQAFCFLMNSLICYETCVGLILHSLCLRSFITWGIAIYMYLAMIMLVTKHIGLKSNILLDVDKHDSPAISQTLVSRFALNRLLLNHFSLRWLI